MHSRYRLKQLLADLRAPVLSPRAAAFLERSRLIAGLILIATVAAIVLTSYIGVSTVNQPVLPGQIANVHLTASEAFHYISPEKTQASRARLTDRIPPVYRLDQTSCDRFGTHLQTLLEQLARFEHDFPTGAPSLTDRRQALTRLVDAFNQLGPYRANPDDVAVLLAAGDAKQRADRIASGLVMLHEIYQAGIHDATLAAATDPGSVVVFQIANADGEIVPRPVQSLEEALVYLRINLAAEDTNRELTLALFRLLRNGIAPNLVFDRETTQQRAAELTKSLPPVTVIVERGQTILEPGVRVTTEQYEMLQAYRRHLEEHGTASLEEGMLLASRALLVLAMVLACIVYIRLEDRETLQSNGRLVLLALVLVLNLALVRATYALLDFDFFVQNSSWAAMLPYCAPTALAPLIVAILIDAGSAIFTAILVSLFAGIIYGNRIDVQVITVLASIVSVYGCRSVRTRGSVVRAATLGGVVVAVFALLFGLLDHMPLTTLGKQMVAGLVTGLLTGMAVVGLLPVLEGLFKRTTDITLLELTDFNHPLLRKMQLEAPGTYHHSLMVAQLAENASAAAGANALLARVCALFHDIGKTSRPDFFTENQHNAINPHDDLSPEESACILRNHVSDGVELARKYRLPRTVLDTIQQHHGTTLMRSFYQRAVQRAPHGQPPDEHLFRYDGPRPQSKETAIIALADSVEAAVRSLKASTPEALAELVNAIFQGRIADGQLDDSALTFTELASVKATFNATLGGMLHSRIAYPAYPVAKTSPS